MDVVPHHGIDEINLGSSRDRIALDLGEPDKKAQDRHEDGAVSEIWIYRLMRLDLSFDSDNEYRLSHITSYHPYTLVGRFNPIGLSEKYLLQKYPHLNLEVEINDDEKYYMDRILDLTFGIARAKVVSVTVFPEYDESGQHIIWPAGANRRKRPSDRDASQRVIGRDRESRRRRP